MPRRNGNALRTGLDIRDRRFRCSHPDRQKHRHGCNCRVCKRAKLRDQGLFHLL